VEGVGARPRLTRLLKHLRRGGHPQPKVSFIQEGRAATKSPNYKFGYFLSISQQVVSAGITKNSAVAILES
jgi:hypothetical protein